jgi:hypothetical protein
MQTFVPFNDMRQIATTLDYRRLGKQRVEVLQILRARHNLTRGWRNHPATLMWKGHEAALAIYGLTMCVEWITRGYKDTCADKIYALSKMGSTSLPSWWGNDKIHASHRAALLAKDFKFYSQYNWNETPNINYVWPTNGVVV